MSSTSSSNMQSSSSFSMESINREENGKFQSIVRQKLLDGVVRSATLATEGTEKWLVMVIDDEAVKVINTVMGMYDIMEHRVTLVELLSRERQPFPDMDVLYIVSPTISSVQRIINDFSDSDSKKKNKKPLYGNAHIFFLSHATDECMDLLASNEILLPRLKNLREINLHLIASEASAFHLDMPNAVRQLYPFTNPLRDRCIDEIASRIVTLCITLNEYAHIRYNASSELGSRIAAEAQNKLDDFMRENEEWWYHGKSGHTQEHNERATILILDRCEDLVTPFMHDCYYQSLCNDLLNVEGEMLKYETTEVTKGKQNENAENAMKKIILNEKDPIWKKARHLHVAEAATVFEEITLELQKRNVQIKNEASIKEIYSHYRPLVEKNAIHRDKLYEKFMSFLLNEENQAYIELEQQIATAVDDDQNPISQDMIYKEIKEQLLKLGSDNLEQKLRLIILYILLFDGMTSNERAELLDNAAQLTSSEQRILQNLSSLGISTARSSHVGSEGEKSTKSTKENVPKSNSNFLTSGLNWMKKGVIGGGTESKKTLNPGEMLKKKFRYEPTDLLFDRYKSKLRYILKQLVSDTLSIEDYPSVVPMPPKQNSSSSHGAVSLRQRSNNQRTTGTVNSESFKGARAIVFVAGGITFHEIRCGYQEMAEQKKEVIVGGTSFLTCKNLIEEVKNIPV